MWRAGQGRLRAHFRAPTSMQAASTTPALVGGYCSRKGHVQSSCGQGVGRGSRGAAGKSMQGAAHPSQRPPPSRSRRCRARA